MLIAATSDLDYLGVNLEPFWEALKKVIQPDLFLFAGDMYEYRNPDQYGTILDFIKLRNWKCPIVAIFGNREFPEDEDDIKKVCGKKITFLNDESIVLKIKNKTVGIVGSRGSLDMPTWWQSHHVKGVKDMYQQKIEKAEKLLKELDTDIKILLTHYATTYKTLKGEDPDIYPGLGSQKYEKVIEQTKPTFVIHGHVHFGIPLAFVNSIPVFNVSFHLNKKIVEIDTENLPKIGLKKYE